MYYLKATFGPNTADAVLEIPVSVNNSNMLFGLYYQISSPKIVLELYVSRNGNIMQPDSVVYSDQYKSGQWTDLYAAVDSDVDAVVLHANKKGITTTPEYVLVDQMHIVMDTTTGNHRYLVLEWKAVQFWRELFSCQLEETSTNCHHFILCIPTNGCAKIL